MKKKNNIKLKSKANATSKEQGKFSIDDAIKLANKLHKEAFTISEQDKKSFANSVANMAERG